MALPDYLKIEHGSAVVWGEAGATGVTTTLSLNGLASAAGRMGVYADLGATWDEEYAVFLRIETGTAPTAGTTVELYLPCSYDALVWPGKVTGADAAYTVANKTQLGAPASILVATAESNAELTQAAAIWRPEGRYVAPVVINSLGQAVRSTGTASDNKSRVIIVPRRLVLQD